MKYRIIKDVEIFNQILFKKGSIIEKKEKYKRTGGIGHTGE